MASSTDFLEILRNTLELYTNKMFYAQVSLNRSVAILNT